MMMTMAEAGNLKYPSFARRWIILIHSKNGRRATTPLWKYKIGSPLSTIGAGFLKGKTAEYGTTVVSQADSPAYFVPPIYLITKFVQTRHFFSAPKPEITRPSHAQKLSQDCLA